VTEVAHARTTDPDTSHAAAASIPSDKIRASQAAVLEVMKEFGPMSDVVLVAYYQGTGQPPQSESGIRTRRKELVTLGKIRDSGRKTVLASGRMAIVWEVAL
jgi:hypothetical protein